MRRNYALTKVSVVVVSGAVQFSVVDGELPVIHCKF